MGAKVHRTRSKSNITFDSYAMMTLVVAKLLKDLVS